MGSTDSLETLATSQDLESISSRSSGWGLTGSSPSPEVGLNKENSSSQVAVSEENLRERESNQQASPRDREEKTVAGKKGKIDAPKPRFKRKFSCVTSSQPICGTEFDLGKTTNYKIEYKKQAQITKKLRLRADRAEEKLELVRSQLKKVLDIVMK